jgi:peroxiredoxin Q/BCP
MTAFGTSHGEFAGADAQVLGVSMDDLETQKKFAESLKSPFPLLADPKGEAAAAYGVKTEMPNGAVVASRVTFVIDKNGKVTKVIEGRDALDPAGALSACKGGS